MESKGQEEHSGLGSSDPEKSVANLSSDTLAVEGGIGNPKSSCASEEIQKGESHIDIDEPEYREIGKHVVVAEDGGFQESAVFLVKEATGTISIRDEFSEEANLVSPNTESKKMGAQSREDINQESTRLAVPQIRPRSLSPVAELNNGNKRAAVICDFFAKGWCIKGNSCRFLHIKDCANITSQKFEGDVAFLDEKSELQADGGVREGSERSRSSFSLERTPSREHGESPRRHQLLEKHKISSLQRDYLSHAVSPDSLQSPIYKDIARPISSFKDVGGENLKQSWSSDDHPTYRDSCFPGLSPSLPTIGIFPSQNISSLTRSSFSFGSLDKDPLGAQKFPGSVGEYLASGSASRLQSSSPFSGSESGNLSLKNVSGDPLHIAGHRTKILSNDWEPSVPFRSSFLISQNLSSPGSLYDPIRDSIEQPNFGDGFSKSSSRPETSTNTYLSINSDPVLKRTLGPEFGLGKQPSFSFGHHILHDDMSDKKVQGKNLFTTEGENVNIFHAEQQSTLYKEGKVLSPSRLKDIPIASKMHFDSGSSIELDVRRQKMDLKIDSGRQNHERDDDLKTDGEQKESKALRNFRAALVDFVKELVKPFWREGQLSKDAHKIIVRKAVDKVLSTLQPHQIPSAEESIKQYLSASEPKILKLVEGYYVKYGKY
ncbi:hypothetical protein Acr_00g0101610 [Actinidia rufa]|uniref:C3H1-type domain-containing protein n=1 Tax=Actinidia rufa TaxID=165716 RepID=A0A7J0E177_9ERIC|nr:hypothetical protein Acr_00g0101610 [Actinidia rufa]